MTRPRIFTRAECVGMRRCPDCQMHLLHQGHTDDCPNKETDG
jgi:hypothetical protein